MKTEMEMEAFVQLYRESSAAWHLKESYPDQSEEWVRNNAKTIVANQDALAKFIEKNPDLPFFKPATKLFSEYGKAGGDVEIKGGHGD